MIKYDHIMVRYGELSTKGKNKGDFIHTLFINIKRALKDFPEVELKERHDHIYIQLNNYDYNPIIERLQDVSGIQGLSLVYKATDRDIDNLKDLSLKLIKNEKGKTFKVNVKRSDKSYPLISDQITRIVAGHILKKMGDRLKVDVHNPDIMLSIEVRAEAAYIFCT